MILFSTKTFACVINQNCARLILIFGVLAGLFFSGGEGIQLLPFPFTKAETSKISASNLEENSKSYAFSVFSSRNYSAQLKSKHQKDANQYLSGERFTLDRPEIRADFCRQAVKLAEEAGLLHTSLVLSAPSDRAPPVI
jgi:hypothetical protein